MTRCTAAANPLMSFSVFNDFADKKDLTLIRVDILNRGIEDAEGYKVTQLMLDAYSNDAEYQLLVVPFNAEPDSFDVDDFISRQSEKWRTMTKGGDKDTPS